MYELLLKALSGGQEQIVRKDRVVSSLLAGSWPYSPSGREPTLGSSQIVFHHTKHPDGAVGAVELKLLMNLARDFSKSHN